MADEQQMPPVPQGERQQKPAAAPDGEDRVIRLASIVSIDVAGFSSLSERDQRRAAENVERLHARIQSVAARHQGRIFNTAGDGFMLEFASAGAALEAINELLDKRPKKIKEPPIRIGAHVGDVVVTVGNDLLGHGVNVAARLQSLASPNTALVSGEFRSMARNSPSAAFKPKGRQPLENIDERVATFAIVSQKQRLRRTLTRGAVGLGLAGVVALAAVFAGPQVLREIDRQDLFTTAGEAAAGARLQLPTVTIGADPQTPAATPRRPGEAFSDCQGCPLMMGIPGGAFMMGSPADDESRAADEPLQSDVAIEPFAIGVYEVTFAEWDACVAGGGCAGFSPPDQGFGRGRQPVTGVSWIDAQGYVQWLNRQIGAPLYRLPSEAEWEYAARAGTATPFATPEPPTAQQAQFLAERPAAVGSFPANGFGLFDMPGNAAEWVQGCFDAAAGEACPTRARRGGGFADPVERLRVAARAQGAPTARDVGVGFRVARALEPQAAE